MLKDAQADPKGVVAQDLLKKMLPFLSIPGRQVRTRTNTTPSGTEASAEG